MRPIIFDIGTNIYSRGNQTANTFYVIVQGTVEQVFFSEAAEAEIEPDSCTYEMTNCDSFMARQKTGDAAQDKPESETKIKIAGDIFGLEEFDLASSQLKSRKTSAVAVSQVRALEVAYKDYMRVCNTGLTEQKKDVMHFIRTCHPSSYFAKLKENSSLNHLIPIMSPMRFSQGDIIASQGYSESKVYILKTGWVQVHVEILLVDFSYKAIGPSQWSVTQSTRTIQVADKVLIENRGEVFGHTERLLQDDSIQACYFTAMTANVDLYAVSVKKFIEAANDQELSNFFQCQDSIGLDRPQFHLKRQTAEDLVSQFLQTTEGLELTKKPPSNTSPKVPYQIKPNKLKQQSYSIMKDPATSVPIVTHTNFTSASIFETQRTALLDLNSGAEGKQQKQGEQPILNLKIKKLQN